MLRRVIVDDGHAGIRGLVTYLTYYVVKPFLCLCTWINVANAALPS